MAGRARVVEADLYDAPTAIPEPGSFDLVFVTWGALNWLPDMRRWAEIVARFLQPGGALYLAEGIPPRWSSTTRRRARATCPAGTRRISCASRW